MKIGIVGAGIMGRLLALDRLQRGDEVTLFDQYSALSPMNCSMAAAGLLAPVSELEKSAYLIYQLGRDALHMHWPGILSVLGDDIYFKKDGCLMLSHPNDKAELTRFIDLIADKASYHSCCELDRLPSPGEGAQRAEGGIKRESVFHSPIRLWHLPPEREGDLIHSKNDSWLYQQLNRDELRDIEPELTKFSDAYLLPEEGQIDSQALLVALAQHLQQEKLTWHENTFVHDINAGEIKTNKGIYHFDLVIDCRGLGAKSIFTTLQSIRGELIWLHAPDVNIKRPVRFLHPRYSLYLVPRPNHVYLIGATEIHTEDDSQISVRSVLELLTAAFYVHPGFAEARILKTVTQCRPSLPNCLPKIIYKKGLLAVNGLYRHGFLIAPTLAAEISQWLEQGMSAVQYPQIWEAI